MTGTGIIAADTRGGVRLMKQRSDSPCNQGYSWGFDRGGVWVDRGCRADFAVDSYQYSRARPGSTGTISCSSDEAAGITAAPVRGANSPGAAAQRVPCREGYSWGSDGRGVWVDHGCRADFAVEGGRGAGAGTAIAIGIATRAARTRSFPVHRTTCTVTTARRTLEAECGCSSSAAILPAARATAGATTAAESGWITAAAPISRSSVNLKTRWGFFRQRHDTTHQSHDAGTKYHEAGLLLPCLVRFSDCPPSEFSPRSEVKMNKF